MGRARLLPLSAGDVWNALTAAYGIAGSYGKLLEDQLDMAVSRAAKFAELNVRGLLFFKRAVTLGTDSGTAGGSAAHSQIAADEPLYSELTTKAEAAANYTSFGAHGIARAARMPADGIGGTLTLEARMRLVQMTNCAMGVGLSAAGLYAAALDVNPSAQIFYDNTVGANWRARSYQTEAELTDTGVAANTNWHVFKIVVTASNVKFYIDGVLVATHSTQIPNAGLPNYVNRVAVGVLANEAVAKKGRYEYVAVYNEV